MTGKDVLFYNVFMISLTYVLWLVFDWVNYPGSSIFWAVILCLLGSGAMAVLYGLFAQVFPRTGGEYVYVTRSLPPVLGMIASWNMAAALTWDAGASAAAVAYGGFSPMLTTLSLFTGNKSFLSSAAWTQTPEGTIIIGQLVIVFFGVLLILGMKRYFTVQKVMFAFAIIGFAIGAVLMWTTSKETFILRFNNFMYPLSNQTDAYHAIITTAQQQGLTTEVPFSALQTLKLTVWVYLAFGFCALSSSFAGEIKNVKRNQMLGGLFGVIVCAVVTILWAYGGEHAFGADFMQAVAYLNVNSPGTSLLPTSPWLSLFASVLTDNIVLIALIQFGVFAMYFILPAVCIIYATRAVLAWSIDRLTPDKLGEVHDKFHTPVYAVVTIIIFVSIANALYSFMGNTSFLLNLLLWTTFIQSVTFVLLGIAATVFPYIRKEFYQGSPAQIEIAGVPVISILGVIVLIYVLTQMYLLATDPVVGTNTPQAYAAVISCTIAGGLFYYALKWIRRRQGINVELAYKLIPIE